MAGALKELGDSHNFGRRVSMRSGRVEKPRTLLWEWILLSKKSPLRRFLAGAARADGLSDDAFSFLPELAFFPPPPKNWRAVEHIQLAPLGSLSRNERNSIAEIAGRAIALFSWLGVADLHWENIVLGRNKKERIVFGPLDIEMVLADMSSPTETKLLPDADPEVAEVCRHAAGMRRLLPYLGKPVTAPTLLSIARAYAQTLTFLDRHSKGVAEIFAVSPGLQEAPIRICLRGTDEYVRARTEDVWPPLLDAEREQLARGDIPYFFRLYGRPGIHYYGDRSLRKIHRLPQKGDAPQLDSILSIRRGLRSPSRKILREEGLFALLGAFDHPLLTGRHANDDLAVTFRKRSLVLELSNGEELRVSRNLGAFVGSIYLPCRCGEVRSVFVPKTTICKPARGSAL